MACSRLKRLFGFLLLFHHGNLQFRFLLRKGGVQGGNGLVLLRQGQTPLGVFLPGDGVQQVFQAADFRLLGAQFQVLLIHLALELLPGPGSLQRLFGLLPGFHLPEAALYLHLKLGILHLAEDGGIVGFIHLEHVSTFGASQFYFLFMLT